MWFQTADAANKGLHASVVSSAVSVVEHFIYGSKVFLHLRNVAKSEEKKRLCSLHDEESRSKMLTKALNVPGDAVCELLKCWGVVE